MDIFTLLVWILTAIFLVFSFKRDKEKTKGALEKAFLMGRGMILSILTVIFAISILLAIISPQQIATFIAKQSIFFASIISALFGSVTLIPAFIAFPLVGTLVDAGTAVVPAVAFLTTLTMVGVVTFPLEKKAFGVKFTLTRNILSFVFAIAIALVMGMII